MTWTPGNAVKIQVCKEPGCPIWTPHTQHLGPNVVVSVTKETTK
jgi:hypothetical protein